MLFWMSVIIWHSRQAVVGFIFQDSCFKKGQFEPSVAYKSVTNKKKRVGVHFSSKNCFLKNAYFREGTSIPK